MVNLALQVERGERGQNAKITNHNDTVNPVQPARSAFTLVELLVVIAIISILVGLMLPALGRAIGSARQVECLNNLRQLGMAFINYADDYDNNILPITDTPQVRFQWMLDPYLDGPNPAVPSSAVTQRIWLCPSKVDTGPPAFLTVPGTGPWDISFIGYGYNKAYSDLPIKQHHVKKPSEKVLLSEAKNPEGIATSYYYAAEIRNGRFDHGNSDLMNILFSDYHVGSEVTYHQMFSGYPDAQPWWTPGL